jgi:dTDP-4-amino-4,6-dideoxygalactose transaminase
MFYSQVNTLPLKKLLYIYYLYLRKRGEQRDIFYRTVGSYFNSGNVYDFNLARSAFEHIVITQKIRKIIMPAFLCTIFDDILIRRRVKPIFVDVDLKTLNIHVPEVQEAMSRGVDAILAVHTFGNPCDISALVDLKEDYSALLIEDCAHSLGAKYKGRAVGTFGDFSIFSMYKYFPTISGGFLISRSSLTGAEYEKEKFNLKKLIRLVYITETFHPIMFRLKEFSGGELVRSSGSRKAHIKKCSDMDVTIFNYFFKSIEEQVAGRNRVAKLFDTKISSNNVVKQKILKGSVSSRQSYPLIVKVPEARDYILKKLRKRGIMADRTWHDAIIFSPVIKRAYKVDSLRYPKAVSAARGIITLPIHSNYDERDVDFIVNAVNQELAKL